MILTYEDFTAVCPSAMAPDEGLYAALQDFTAEADDAVFALMGQDIYTRVNNPEGHPAEASVLRTAARAARRYIAAWAYREGLAHLDLVLTATGFGVVSNQNVAPASRDRVEALRSQLTRQADRYLDALLDALHGIAGWYGTPGQQRHMGSLFWAADQLGAFGYASPSRDNLAALRPMIDEGEAALAAFISYDLLAAMIQAEASDKVSSRMQKLITLCRAYVAKRTDSPQGAQMYREMILRYVEDNLDAFPEYATSSAYAANHCARYENKADDPCYFFG